MRTVYVTQAGAVVRRDGGRLKVFTRDGLAGEVRMADLGQLVLMGNVTLTPSALDLILESSVDTVFLTMHGRYRGRITQGTSTHVTLRMAQYSFLREPERALDLAREIVLAKIHNGRALMLRHRRRRGPSPDLERCAVRMAAAAARASRATTLDELRGCEGSGAAAFFDGMKHLLTAPGFTFEGRNRRPPMDPVNALLSMGYTLLYNVVEAAVHVVGLDPYLGALHAPLSARPSLVCDLAEEFRAPVVDALVIAALNKGMLDGADFEEQAPGEPVLLRREGLARFARLFEQRLTSSVIYPPVGQNLTYRSIIEQQARLLARLFLDQAPRYVGFRVR